MNKILIRPQWMLKEHGNSQPQRFPTLLSLLSAIYAEGNLTTACHVAGVSYRHAWGLIKDGRQIFGVPLVHLTRGRGAKLTTLGEKLVWADKRIGARLSPILDSLASELEAEIERACADSKAILRIHASHGYAVAALRDFLVDRGFSVELQFRASVDALASLCQSNCELAGFHVPVGELQSLALEQYVKWLKPRTHKFVHVVTRRQGIMVAKGNPKQITSLADLARPGIRFVNRQHGSGTRKLLELLLNRENLGSQKINGYETAEFTHDAVAAYIASGMADAGVGVEAGARKFNLDFVPLISERYFLVCHNDAVATESVQEVISILRSSEFKTFINNHHGLDSEVSGTVMSINEAFPDLQMSNKRGLDGFGEPPAIA